MLRYISILIVLITLTNLIGCSENSGVEESFKISNPESQKKLVTELKAKGISIRIDNKGQVWFPARHRDTVHEIAFKVMKESVPDRKTYAYTDSKYTDMLISKLRTAGVPFHTVVKNSATHIVLEYKDNVNWAPIKEEVDLLYEKEILLNLEVKKQ